MSAPDAGAESSGGAGLLAAWRVLRERWWIVVLTALITMILAVILSLASHKQYQATSKVVLETSSQLNNVVLNGAATNSNSETQAATALLLVTSNPVAEAVNRSLKLEESTEELLGQVTASAEPNSNLIDIKAQDSSPQRSAQIATAFAEQYVAYRQRSALAQVSQGEKLLRERLEKLPPTATADRAQLQDALQKVIALEAVQTGEASVVDTAQVPKSASSPKPKRNALVGAILGLLLGFGLAFLVDLLDRRVKTVEAFEAAYGLRTLVVVPPASFSSRREDLHSAGFEPYRILRSTIAFSTMAGEAHAVLLTSAAPREGKTTVAVNLARAVALAGQTVILVEADLRRPTLSQHFSLQGTAGLTTAVIDGRPVAEVVQHPVPELPSLSVLPCGPTPPNAAELLRSAEMDEVIDDLLSSNRLVIFDAPPILGLADAQTMLDNPRIDTALIVARAYQTTREEIRRTRAIIAQRRVKPMGLVITGLGEAGDVQSYYDEAPDEHRSPAQGLGRIPQGAGRIR
ncbi:MAG TPA: polysaccharide biosynthesis tyrosine autokinase [Solirubrobacteraceae bacterium]|jgi:succinoglycan biosynthesis transport protein ExoP|nr:polysaccharide biosynthesis tyrosine autokinase [Solirubrobacteraceae bacterium]